MLSFKAKDLHSGKFNKTNWIMHEFSLANQEFVRINTILCVIYKQNKGSGLVCEEANGRGLKRDFYSTIAAEEFSYFNIATAMMSLEPRKRLHLELKPKLKLEMASAIDEEFGQEDAQTQEHRKRRLDAGADAKAYTDEEFAAWIADPMHIPR
ncbi:hypothetical protein SO802_032362 [Lithocarpus litseifolius]|uniref:NAC domain-containing protein n=1 Tax=Lithocarpus litseifolius TaxID=425828 RepID=A0AAW2BN82_9ROSI